MSRTGEHIPRNTRVVCPICRNPRTVSQRQAHTIRTSRNAVYCVDCRTKPLTVTQEHRNYWLKRYTHEEIQDLAAGIDMLLNDHSRYATNRRTRQESR